MDETTAIFILIMTGMIISTYLLALWIKSRRAPAPAATIAEPKEAGQIEALRRENNRLHERITVLETIATDPAQRTAREIESLR